MTMARKVPAVGECVDRHIREPVRFVLGVLPCPIGAFIHHDVNTATSQATPPRRWRDSVVTTGGVLLATESRIWCD